MQMLDKPLRDGWLVDQKWHDMIPTAATNQAGCQSFLTSKPPPGLQRRCGCRESSPQLLILFIRKPDGKAVHLVGWGGAGCLCFLSFTPFHLSSTGPEWHDQERAEHDFLNTFLIS